MPLATRDGRREEVQPLTGCAQKAERVTLLWAVREEDVTASDDGFGAAASCSLLGGA